MSTGGEWFICVGEHSGDLLAADLALAVKHLAPDLHFFGLTGQAMRQAGVESLASIEALGVMGIWEVAAKLADIRMLEQELLAAIDRRRPQVAVLVDFPGFHFRLAEQLRLRGVRVFQYIAPKVWAWGEKRLARLRRDFDLVLGVLPFETAYFAQHKVPFTYVGSPHKDRCARVHADRGRLGFAAGRPLVGFLPGSRVAEIKRLLPVMNAVKAAVKRRFPDAQFAIPIAPSLERSTVETCLYGSGEAGRGQADDFTLLAGKSLELMAVADVCCVASGTATLECGLLGTPLVVVYAMNELSYHIARKKVKIPSVSLVNIVLGERVVSEYIQEFSPQAVADEVCQLLGDPRKRGAMQVRLARLRDLLSGDAAQAAAQAMLKASGRQGFESYEASHC